jgi:hypothetical protein
MSGNIEGSDKTKKRVLLSVSFCWWLVSTVDGIFMYVLLDVENIKLYGRYTYRNGIMPKGFKGS